LCANPKHQIIYRNSTAICKPFDAYNLYGRNLFNKYIKKIKNCETYLIETRTQSYCCFFGHFAQYVVVSLFSFTFTYWTHSPHPCQLTKITSFKFYIFTSLSFLPLTGKTFYSLFCFIYLTIISLLLFICRKIVIWLLFFYDKLDCLVWLLHNMVIFVSYTRFIHRANKFYFCQ